MMFDRRAVIGSAAALALSSSMARAVAPPIEGDAISNLLRGRTAPGGFVAVTHAGELERFHAWGRASIPFDRPVTPATLFQIGSCGKHFTALAVLRLANAGKVGLARPIGDYVKGLPSAWSAIPLQRLLTHTSGIADYSDYFPDWDREQSRQTILAKMATVPAEFAAGDAWAYSNTGFLILGWLIEDVSKRSYADFVRSELLERAGLINSRPDAADEPIPDRAEPYTSSGDRLVHAVRMEHGVSAAADGGMLLSAQDAARWRAAIDGGRIVPKRTLDAVLVPEPLSTGRSAPYAHGWFLDRTRGRPLLAHSGGVPGFLTYWLVQPDSGRSALAAANYEGSNDAPLAAIAAAALEAVAPGSTFASLPVGREDARSRATLRLLARGKAAPDPKLLAPELARLAPQRLRHAPTAIESLLPVESYVANGGEMVRYRTITARGAGHILAGWTKDERLFWLS
jgi:D-alanyl-D-alanine carboxypeptidase